MNTNTKISENKNVIDSLKNFTKAWEELNSAWINNPNNSAKYSSSVDFALSGDNYPFEECFSDLSVKVKKWCDDGVNALRTQIIEDTDNDRYIWIQYNEDGKFLGFNYMHGLGDDFNKSFHVIDEKLSAHAKRQVDSIGDWLNAEMTHVSYTEFIVKVITCVIAQDMSISHERAMLYESAVTKYNTLLEIQGADGISRKAVMNTTNMGVLMCSDEARKKLDFHKMNDYKIIEINKENIWCIKG